MSRYSKSLWTRRRLLGTGAAALAAPVIAPRRAWAAGNEIRIGFVSPTTGPISGFGAGDDYVFQTLQPVFDQGVDIDGKHYDIKIIRKDSQSNPNRAAEVAKELILRDEVNSYAGAEAQLASLADDIAYNNHDIEDGLRAGLFALEELAELPLLGELVKEVKVARQSMAERRQTHEVIRRMINRMVNDLITQTRSNIEVSGTQSAGDIRALGKPVAAFSAEMQAVNKEIKAFLMARMYRHYRVNRMTSKAARVVKKLFAFFLAEPECLPPAWFAGCDGPGGQKTAETVCDFIAGMTDRFALEEYARIFDPMERT